MLVRDVQYHLIDSKQLQVLLGYAEQDIHDYTRQATAFTLLKVKSEDLDVCYRKVECSKKAFQSNDNRPLEQV